MAVLMAKSEAVCDAIYRLPAAAFQSTSMTTTPPSTVAG